MIKDLLIAEKKGYTISFNIDDGSSYKGKIKFADNRKLIKIKNDFETVWFSIDNVIHYSIIYEFSKGEEKLCL